jgi:hypothetical protein
VFIDTGRGQDPLRAGHQPSCLHRIEVTADGTRDILGTWIGTGGEGAKFWLRVAQVGILSAWPAGRRSPPDGTYGALAVQMNLGNSGSPILDRRWEGVGMPTWEDFWHRVSVVLFSMPPRSHRLLRGSDSPQIVDVTAEPPAFVVRRHSSTIYQRRISSVDEIVPQMVTTLLVHWRSGSPRSLSFAFIGAAVERNLRWLLVGAADPTAWKDLSTSGEGSTTVKLSGADQVRLQHLRSALPEE